MIRMTNGLHLRGLISRGVSTWLRSWNSGFLFTASWAHSLFWMCVCGWDFSKLVIYVASHFHMIILLHDINPQMRVSGSYNLYLLCTNTQFSIKENAFFFFWQESAMSSSVFSPS